MISNLKFNIKIYEFELPEQPQILYLYTLMYIDSLIRCLIY